MFLGVNGFLDRRHHVVQFHALLQPQAGRFQFGPDQFQRLVLRHERGGTNRDASERPAAILIQRLFQHRGHHGGGLLDGGRVVPWNNRDVRIQRGRRRRGFIVRRFGARRRRQRQQAQQRRESGRLLPARRHAGQQLRHPLDFGQRRIAGCSSIRLNRLDLHRFSPCVWITANASSLAGKTAPKNMSTAVWKPRISKESDVATGHQFSLSGGGAVRQKAAP